MDKRIGYLTPPEPPRYKVPECPCCGSECYYYFLDTNLAVIGCDECHKKGESYDSVVDAYEYGKEAVW